MGGDWVVPEKRTKPVLSGEQLRNEVENAHLGRGEVAVWWLTQASWLVKFRKTTILIDPWWRDLDAGDSWGKLLGEFFKLSGKFFFLFFGEFLLLEFFLQRFQGFGGFGEIAMQVIAGEEHGIDTSYGDSCDDNCDSQLESRAANISADDGTDFPVHFSDNDRDGKLSAGDQFTVYGTGNSANGPAEDNWRLDIQLDADGTIVGSAKLL